MADTNQIKDQIKASNAEELQDQDIKELDQTAVINPSKADKKDTLIDAARFVSDINKISAESRFVINDIVLSVPPTSIRVDRNNVNYKWHTLRSKRPAKVKSGHGNIQVGLSIYFVGADAINNGLRKLMVELEHHPFIYVENSYLKDNILPGSSQNMAFTVLDFTVRTESNLIDTLVLDLDMTWFNYKPFSRDFTYRQTWEAPTSNSIESQDSDKQLANDNQTAVQPQDKDKNTRSDIQGYADNEIKLHNLMLKSTIPVSTPSESVPYKQYYDDLLTKRRPLLNNKGDVSSILQQSLTLTFYTFKEAKLPSSLDFLANRTLKPGEIIQVDEAHIVRIGNANMFMRPKAAQDLAQLAQEFESKFKKALPISSCFRSFEEQSKLASDPKTKDVANKAGTSFHECGLAFDISFRSLTPDEYVWVVQNAPKMQIAGFKIDSRYRTLADRELKDLYDRALRGNPSAKEMWHFTHQSESNVQEVLQKIYINEGSFGQTQPRNQLQQSYTQWLKDQLKGGWEEVSGFTRVFKKPRSLVIPDKNTLPTPPGNKMVIASLALSMNNIVANLPLASHLYSTHQYLGSTDKELYLSMLSHGTVPLHEIQLMNNIVELNARQFRAIPGSSLIYLDGNNIINDLFNIKSVLIESITTETIEGSPDLFAINLRLTEYNSDSNEKIAIEFVNDDSLRTKVITRLASQLQKVDAVLPILGAAPLKTYKKINTDNNIVLTGDSSTGVKGLLDEFITILENLNFCIPTDEFKNIYGIPDAKPSLYGAEKLLIPRLGSIQDSFRDTTIVPNGSNNIVENQVAKVVQKHLLDVLKANFFATSEFLSGFISSIVTDRTFEEAINDGSKDAGQSLDVIQKQALEAGRGHIQQLADKIIANYLDLPIFKDIRLEARKSNYIKGGPAYPDLNLPPHPLTGSTLDTEPDWYFYNGAEEQENSIISTKVANAGKEFLKNSYTSYNTINDGTWFTKIYKSKNSQLPKSDGDKALIHADGYNPLSISKSPGKSLKFSNVAKITGNRNQKLGLYGSSLPRNDPSSQQQKETKFGPIKLTEGEESLHSFSSDAIAKSFDESIKNFRNDAQTLRRAFPTFKIYFIEDELTVRADDTSLRNIRAFDDFYSYNAVKDIRVVRSRKIAADLAVITMTNIAGLLDDKAFYKGKKTAGKYAGTSNENIVGPFNPFEVRNDTPNPWEAIMLQNGQKIQIRLGYSNDPNKLETVFNGRIVELAPSDSGDLIQIVCQSYAVELVQQIKGLSNTPPNLGEAKNIGDTQELLSTLMCEPELTHFGRWQSNPFFNPAEIQIAAKADYFDNQYSSFTPTGLINKLRRKVVENWNFLNLPQDDNIFVPEKNEYYNSWRGLLEFNSLDYYLINTTIWDVFQEMELRHPGWISYPQVYEDRYSMFFGVPSQRYWSKRPSIEEVADLSELKRIRESNQQDTGLSSSSYLAEAAGIAAYHRRFIPFRNYHVLTSENHIISNSIALDSKNSINAVAVEFRPTTFDFLKKSTKFGGFQVASNNNDNPIKLTPARLLTVKADDNIDDNNTRMLHEAYINCEGEYMAARYALALLLRHMKDIYTGEVTVIGNPKMKPHDICFMLDSYSDMFGPIGVEQVTHCFSFEEGFITKIVPDLVVTGNEWYSTPLSDVLGCVVGQAYKELNIGSLSKDTIIATSQGVVGSAVAAGAISTASGMMSLGPQVLGSAAVAGTIEAAPAFVLGLGIFLLGGYKLIEWSQMRQPIHITPLILHGIPYIGGVEGFKHQNLWMYLKGRLLNWATGKEDGSFENAVNALTRTYLNASTNLDENLFKWLSRNLGF